MGTIRIRTEFEPIVNQENQLMNTVIEIPSPKNVKTTNVETNPPNNNQFNLQKLSTVFNNYQFKEKKTESDIDILSDE